MLYFRSKIPCATLQRGGESCPASRSHEVLGFIGSAPTAQSRENQTRPRGALSIKRLEGGREAAAGRTHDCVRD